MKTFRIGKVGFEFHWEKLHLVTAVGNQIPSFFLWYHSGHSTDFSSSSGLVISGMGAPGSGDTHGVEWEKLLEILGGRDSWELVAVIVSSSFRWDFQLVNSF